MTDLARDNFDDIFNPDKGMNIQPFEINNLKKYLEKKKGYVYVAKEPNNPLLKIGRTSKTPWERASTLSTSGLLDRFEILFSCYFMNQVVAEKNIHQMLKKFRVKDKREFFSTNLDVAIKAISDYKSKESFLMENYFHGDIYEYDLSLLDSANYKIINAKKRIFLNSVE